MNKEHKIPLGKYPALDAFKQKVINGSQLRESVIKNPPPPPQTRRHMPAYVPRRDFGDEIRSEDAGYDRK